MVKNNLHNQSGLHKFAFYFVVSAGPMSFIKMLMITEFQATNKICSSGRKIACFIKRSI